jgi:hypothetical protein
MVSPVKYLSPFFPNKKNLTETGFYVLCLTVFLMPFPRSWSLYPLGLFLFLGLLIWLTQTREMTKIFVEKIFYILPPVAYFILHFLYFLSDAKWTYLEDKLMFLLIPIFGLPVFSSGFFRKKLKLFFISFLSGILIICCYQLIRATFDSISFIDGSLKFNSLISPGVSRFNWIQLSSYEHPTYLAIKILWGIVLIYFSDKYCRISGISRVLLILFLSFFVFLLSSRSGIIILILLGIYFIYSILHGIWPKIILFLFVPLIFFGVFKLTTLSPRMKGEFGEIKDKFKIENFDWKNIHYRTRSWYSSLMLIKENPFFGVGLDARNKLTEEYKRRGYTIEAEFRLNSHNQFLETQLTFGIFGTVLLLWMLITPLIRRRKKWNQSLICPFLIIITISMLFESILVRQWGIMFFVLFYCILTIPENVQDS